MNRNRICLITFLVLTAPGLLLSAKEPSIVNEDTGLKAVFQCARTERVAVIALGDSNQRFGGHGFTKYMSNSLGRTFGSYGSGVMIYHPPHGAEAPAMPPEYLAKDLFSYWYIPEGESAQVSWKTGQFFVYDDSLFDVSGHLRFHLTYGTFEDKGGSAQFKPVVRRDTPPWTILASAPASVSSVTDSGGMRNVSLDLHASAERNWQLQFMPVAAGSSIQGPFLAAYANCENVDRSSGIAYSTLYASGGKSVRDMVLTMREKTPRQLSSYFTAVRQTLNGQKLAIVMICSGLNDRNVKEMSVGPDGGHLSSSPEGYSDNLLGLVQTLQEAWVLAGGTEGSIYFAFMPSHALGDPDDEKLVSYREAAASLASTLPNASFINVPALVPYAEMREGKYYDQGRQSDPHLSEAGYEAIANAFAKSMTE